jgi:hypothetical protein
MRKMLNINRLAGAAKIRAAKNFARALGVSAAKNFATTAAIFALTASIFSSCASASRFPQLDDGVQNPGSVGGGRVSIAFLKTLYSGAPTRIEGEFWVSGRVISSDRQGNFHRTLVVEDGTGGIEIKLENERIFRIFEIFSPVSVRCNGLWLGSNGGTLQLGSQPVSEYETGFLTDTGMAEHIFSDAAPPQKPAPPELDFGEISPRHISTFVAFRGVRFADGEQGLDWAETASEVPEGPIPTATDRHLVNARGEILIVRTSRFAEFASWSLPAGEIYIEGVLSLFGSDYQLVISDPSCVVQL